jgi:hypothetical protein
VSVLQDALRRQAERQSTVKRIDYERMNKIHPIQKAALTRAKKSGDPELIANVCKKAIAEWNEVGAWPDDWSVWQNALNDALPWNQSLDLRDL